ncbi:MAG TPA: molecular chaperone DnaK, partial [Pseudohongiella sp.]|nr:molecular chaperone DnaK [Pseudohongiella sp.]
DANGILNVSAKDKATGKEQSIVIKASSGLTDEEIERMVKDAEANAAEDKKFEQLVTARNTADGLIHATRKTLADAGDKVDADEKAKIESAINDLEEAMKAGELEQIEEKTKALTEASSGLAQKMYAEQQGAAGAEGAGADDAGANDKSAGADDAVDAEFEEVKDDK